MPGAGRGGWRRASGATRAYGFFCALAWIAAPAVAQPANASSGELAEIAYVLERVEVRGLKHTLSSAVEAFVPVSVGGLLDVDDPSIEILRYRLLGTGWFDSVRTHLERGSAPGRVLLVIEVQERNTRVIRKLAGGVGWSVGNVRDGGNRAGRRPQPYLGAELADLNFLGRGKQLGLEFLASPDQQGLALSLTDPLLSLPRWALDVRGLFTNGLEYFGGDNVFAAVNCAEVAAGEGEPDCQVQPPAAVVDYWRAGLQLGASRDLGGFTTLSLGYRGDFVRVPPGKIPAAASTARGRGNGPLRRQPIDFAVESGNSYASTLSVGLNFDQRDSHATPSRGVLITFKGDLASGLIGSDYDFVRLQSSVHSWRPLGSSGHVLRLGLYMGSVFGRAPFFYKFFVSDLTDLTPSRILGLNLDHRPAPNIFGLLHSGRAFDDSAGTAISQMRIQELAARVDAEYVWPFKRGGTGFVKSGDLFVLLGLYLLADPEDLRFSVAGYRGLARVPVDLTFDVGFRLDTELGVFRLGLAKLAWLPVTGSTVGGGE